MDSKWHVYNTSQFRRCWMSFEGAQLLDMKLTENRYFLHVFAFHVIREKIHSVWKIVIVENQLCNILQLERTRLPEVLFFRRCLQEIFLIWITHVSRQTATTRPPLHVTIESSFAQILRARPNHIPHLWMDLQFGTNKVLNCVLSCSNRPLKVEY